MKIFLTELPKYTSTWEYDSCSQENIGLEYLAAEARSAGHDVLLISCPAYGLSEKDLKEAIKRYKPEVLGISLPFSDGLIKGLDILSALRDIAGPKTHIVIGGRGATASANEILEKRPEIDSLVCGEGDISFLDLLRSLSINVDWRSIPGLAFRIQSGVHINRNEQLSPDLDLLPFPVRDIPVRAKDMGRPLLELYMSGSRGCPYRCSFCDISVFYRNNGGCWRGRSPSNIVDELDMLVKRYGSDISYCFIDDNFFGIGQQGQERAKKIAKELINRKVGIEFEISCRADSVKMDTMKLLKKAGLRSVYLGVESGVQRALNTFCKGTSPEINDEAIKILSDMGIFYDLGFIMFDPWSSLEENLTNIQFLQRISSTYGVFLHPAIMTSSLKFYPGSTITSKYNSEVRRNDDSFTTDSLPSIYTYYVSDKRSAIIHAVAKRLWKDIFSHSLNKYSNKLTIAQNDITLEGVTKALLEIEEELVLDLKTKYPNPYLSFRKFESAFIAFYNTALHRTLENYRTLKDRNDNELNKAILYE